MSGKPEDARAFLDRQISEEEFFDRLEYKPLTRGPPIIPETCKPDKGENCENSPLKCPCYPNEECNPANPDANDRGCVEEKPLHSHLVGKEYVCDEGYEWSPDLTKCAQK